MHRASLKRFLQMIGFETSYLATRHICSSWDPNNFKTPTLLSALTKNKHSRYSWLEVGTNRDSPKHTVQWAARNNKTFKNIRNKTSFTYPFTTLRLVFLSQSPQKLLQLQLEAHPLLTNAEHQLEAHPLLTIAEHQTERCCLPCSVWLLTLLPTPPFTTHTHI